MENQERQRHCSEGAMTPLHMTASDIRAFDGALRASTEIVHGGEHAMDMVTSGGGGGSYAESPSPQNLANLVIENVPYWDLERVIRSASSSSWPNGSSGGISFPGAASYQVWRDDKGVLHIRGVSP